MNELQIFENPEFGKIRTLQINNQTYFVSKDVADILGYQNGSRDINRHIDDEDKGVAKCDTLILSSKLPTTKRFKHCYI